MNKARWWIAAACAAAMASGCGQSGGGAATGSAPKQQLPSALLPAGEEQNYFPLAEGNQWTFATEAREQYEGQPAQSGAMEITWRCAKVTPTPNGGQEATMEVVNNTGVLTRQLWRVDRTGIYQVATGKKLTHFSTPQLVLPFPVKPGSDFEWKGTIKDDTGAVQQELNKGRVVGEEEVDAMTTSNALAITNEATETNAKTKSQISSKLWLIPNVGIGRLRQEQLATVQTTDPKTKKPVTIRRQRVDVMKLKNFSPSPKK